MKSLAMSLAVFLAASPVLTTQAQAQPNCSWMASDLERMVNDSSFATSQLSSELRSLQVLASALEEAARKTGSAGTVDLSSSLSPLISSAESSIQGASQNLNSGLATLRRTNPDNENLGSKVWQMAGEAAGRFESAVSQMRTADGKITQLKSTVSQLQSKLGGTGTGEVKRRIHQALSGTRGIDRAIQDLNRLEDVSALTRNYTSSCSITTEMVCRDIRSDMNTAASHLREARRMLIDSQRELSLVLRDADRAASALGDSVSNIDLNSQINSLVDSQVLPGIQSAVNDLSEAARQARAASQASSGTEFDQRSAEGIRAAERAQNGVSDASSGLPTVESRISTLDREIKSGLGNADPYELRRAATSVDSLGRSLDRLVSAIGSGDFGSSGDLSVLDRALEAHRRSCEIRDFR